MAFCSEMPFICSSTLRGLWVCISDLFERFIKPPGRRILMKVPHEEPHKGMGESIRICHGLDGIEATVHNELDVSS